MRPKIPGGTRRERQRQELGKELSGEKKRRRKEKEKDVKGNRNGDRMKNDYRTGGYESKTGMEGREGHVKQE